MKTFELFTIGSEGITDARGLVAHARPIPDLAADSWPFSDLDRRPVIAELLATESSTLEIRETAGRVVVTGIIADSSVFLWEQLADAFTEAAKLGATGELTLRDQGELLRRVEVNAAAQRPKTR